MDSIVMGRASEARIDDSALHGMFALRNTIFKERLEWDVDSRNGLEIDVYDELRPVYMIATSSPGEVQGCWRLLPTTGSYMLRDTFTSLLGGEPAPCDERVWELSRFAVAPTGPDDRRQVNFGEVTFQMMRRAYEFGVENGIDSYVTVTSVALERMMRRVGLDLVRLGDGKAVRIGKVLTVACRIDVAGSRDALFGDELRRDAA